MQAIPIRQEPTKQPSNDPSGAAPTNGGIPGQISQEEALKGGEGAKIDPVSLGRITDAANGGSTVSLGSIVEARLCLEIIDSLIPAALVLIFHAAKITLNKSVFQLTAKEKDTLSPVLQKCLESINLNFDSPWIALSVTAGAIYLSKIVEHGGKAKIDQTNEAKKNAAATEQKKADDMQATAKTEKTKRETPIVNMGGTLREWDEEDVKKVKLKRKRGDADARQWLTDNWVKKGGVI